MKWNAPAFDEDAALAGLYDPEDDGWHLGVQANASTSTIVYELEPDDYIHETAGVVAMFTSGGRVTTELGKFIVKQVDVDSAVAEGESVFDIFDHYSSTIGYYDLYATNGWEFSRRVLRALGCEDSFMMPSGMLIIDRLELYPEYRGRGIGLQAMKFLIARYRMGAGIAAIKPFPLQFEGGIQDEPELLRQRGLDKYPPSEVVCQRRLQAHYRKLGFRKIPRTPFMCLPLVGRLGW